MSITLHGTSVTLRPVVGDDVEQLTKILADPAVQRWWGRYDHERVEREFLGADERTVVFSIEVHGQVVGSIQFYEEPSPDYRHAGLDVFLHPDWHGQGLGTDSVRTVARYLVHDRGHHRLVVDPAADNSAAITCLERVGFRKVGIMRQYERGPDGTWHDCLMLEMLKHELQ